MRGTLQAGHAQGPIVDELNGASGAGKFGDHFEQCVVFDLAGEAQPGALAIEVGVVEAGMAAEFVQRVGAVVSDTFEQAAEIGGGNGAGSCYAKRPGSGLLVAVNANAAAEGRSQKLEDILDEPSAEPCTIALERAGPAGFARVTESADAAALCDMKHWSGDCGEEVGVLVRVDVGDVDTSTLKLLDLRLGLASYLFEVKCAAKGGLGKIEEGGSEGLAVRTEQGRDRLGVRDGNAIGKDEVAAYSKSGVAVSDSYCVFKGSTARHEGCRGDHTREVQLFYGAIDAARKAEVIGVDDKTGSHGSFDSKRSGRVGRPRPEEL